MGPAGAMCRTCGTELRHGARFCDGCGAPARNREPAKFKRVTVLFADVVALGSLLRRGGALARHDGRRLRPCGNHYSALWRHGR
jgi:hypothetical protein